MATPSKTEMRNKSLQWCEYDKLARHDTTRRSDIMLLQKLSSDATKEDLMRLVYREEWRMEQEVVTFGRITKQDSATLSSGRASGCGPSGQLLFQERHEELRNLEDEEHGIIYGISDSELTDNYYNCDTSIHSSNVWKPLVTIKDDNIRSIRLKLSTSVAERIGRFSTELQTSLRATSQLITLCERRRNQSRPDNNNYWAITTDPFLYCLTRVMRLRGGWLSSLERFLSASGTSLDLTKFKKASITIQKIESYRKAFNKRIVSNGNISHPARLSESPKTVLPSVPAASSNTLPRTVTPGLELPDIPQKSDPIPIIENKLASQNSIPKSIPNTSLSPQIAAFRLQRWWRRTSYWNSTVLQFVKKTLMNSQVEVSAYLLYLKSVTSHVIDASITSKAAVIIQRHVRGYLHGRLLARRRLRAVVIFQKSFRGQLARKRISIIKMVRDVQVRKEGFDLLKEYIDDDVKEVNIVKEYVETILNISAEIKRVETTLKEEDHAFRSQWNTWESNMTEHCLNNVPLDTDWVPQTLPSGQNQFLNVKTKRTTTQHPNLKLAEIHRKRQWIKVGRVRDEKKASFEAYGAKLQSVLERRKQELENDIAALRDGEVS